MRRDDSPSTKPSPADGPPHDRPDDRWVCGHADSAAPCSHGPTPEGRCPVLGPCTPRRSWHARRRVATRIVTAASLAVLLIAMLGPWRRDVFAPGALSGPHAQILGGQFRNDRCAACHTVARDRLAAWFGSGGAGHVGVSQSQLCIDCHHTTIQRERALTAHNLTPAELQRISTVAASHPGGGRSGVTWHDSMPRPAFPSNAVHCSACHREHHGKAADLTWMSDAQCQTCHQDRFASFADGHPDWREWPYGRGGQIAFNHTTHRGDHFAKEGQAFDCQSCHSVSTDGEIARTGTFETTCAACHDQALRLQTGRGIDLVALPILDIDAVRRAGLSVGPWPESARGVEAVSLAPLTRTLLSSDPQVTEAIDQLTAPTANLWQGPPSPARLRATAEVAAGLRELVDGMARDVRGEVERRLRDPAAADLVGQLSPQTFAAARDRWFPSQPPQQLSADQKRIDPFVRPAGGDLLLPQDDGLLLFDPLAPDPLAPDPLATDPLATDPLATDGEGGLAQAENDGQRFEAAQVLPAGGWYRDDLRMAIRYRAAGHADPVLRFLLELVSGETFSAADRAAIRQLPAVAACVECHPGVRHGDAASWRSARSDANRRTFTRFSHRPHLNLPELSDCTHCHAEGGATAAEMLADFAPLERASCVACHTPQAAGDNCTKCHRYHTDPPLGE